MMGRWSRLLPRLAAFGMEGCWLLALLVVANDLVAGGALPAAWLFSVYPVSLALNRGLGALRLKRLHSIAASSVLALIAASVLAKVVLYPELAALPVSWWGDWLADLGGILSADSRTPAAWLMLLATGLLWWRGFSLAMNRPGFGQLVVRFQFGAGILVLLLLAAGAAETVELRGASQYVAVFFLFSMVSFAAARASEQPDIGALRQHRLWLSLVAIVSVLLVGVIIGNYVTGDLLRLLVRPLVMAWRVIESGLLYLASLFHSTAAPLPEVLPAGEAADIPPEYIPDAFNIPEAVRKLGSLAVMGTFAVLLLVALYQVSSQAWEWLRRQMGSASPGVVESLPGAFGADVKAALSAILSWVLRLVPWRRLQSLAAGLHVARGRTTRHAYADMQRWAARMGRPRRPQETPLEFAHALGQVLPAGRDDLAVIAAAYVQVRYGGQPGSAHYEEVEARWKRLRRLKPASRPGAA